MPPKEERDEVVGMTYGEMIRALYLQNVGDGTKDNPGLLMRVRLLEEEVEARRRIHDNRIAIWVMGAGCGVIPSLIVVALEHFWK